MDAITKIPGAKSIGSKAGPAAIVGFAGYAAYEGYKVGGVPGAAMGVADSLTMGGLSLLNEKARASLLPNDGQDRTYHAPRSGKAYLNVAAAKKAAAGKPIASSTRRAAAPTPSSNGWVQEYTRNDGTRVASYKRV